MSDSINIQVNKWKNNRWAWFRSTGAATGSRACLSLRQLNTALHCLAFPPSPYRHGRRSWQPPRDVPASGAARSPRQGRGRQAVVGSQRWASPSPPARLSPMVRRGRRWQQQWHYQTTHKNQPSPWPDGSRGHFGPFSVTLAPWACTVLPPQPPWISAQSPYFAIHISSPTAVPPFPWGGAQLEQPPLPPSKLFASPQHHPGHVPSLPAGPLPEAGKLHAV